MKLENYEKKSYFCMWLSENMKFLKKIVLKKIHECEKFKYFCILNKIFKILCIN